MKIAQIIEKKINGSLNNREKNYFNRWMAESKENRALFNRLQVLEQQGGDIFQIMKVDQEIAWNQILELSRVKKEKKVEHFSFAPLLKYAAIFIGAIGLVYGYWRSIPSDQNTVNMEDDITLQRHFGIVVAIYDDQWQIPLKLIGFDSRVNVSEG